MPLSDVEKLAMVAATHEVGLNLIDDLVHIREVVGKIDITSGDLRRLSNQLRRLLIDNGGDLRKISPPRLNRPLKLLAPSTKTSKRAIRDNLYTFYSLGQSGIYGTRTEEFFIRTIYTARPNNHSPFITYKKPALVGHKEQYVELKLSNFLSQQILYFYGQWVSRSDIIKYVANVGGGVHSGDHRERSHEVMQRIRRLGSIKLIDGHAKWRGHLGAARDHRIHIERDGVDMVLNQIMAAARYISISPDIIELENIIMNEII